jgi:PKD domain
MSLCAGWRAVVCLFISTGLVACHSSYESEPRADAAERGTPDGVTFSALTAKPVSQYDLVGCTAYAVTNTLLGSKLVNVDVRSETSKAIGTAYLTYNLTGLAVDPATHKLYAVDSTSLYQVDPETAQVTRVGLINVLLGLAKGLQFAPDGQLYTFTTLGGLTRIDKSNGRGTKVFNSLLPSLLPSDAFTYSADGTKIYVALLNNLYSLNPSTGAATLLPGKLPVSVSAMHARADGKLVLVPKQAIALGYELVVFDLATQKTIITYPIIPKSQLAVGSFTAFSYPFECPAFVGGGQATMIKNVTLSKTSVCVGETISVGVTAAHPENATLPVDVSVNGLPGNTQRVQILDVGQVEVAINAQTRDGYVDSKILKVESHTCTEALPAPRLRLSGNILIPEGADLTVLNAKDYSAGATYAWTFGDGTVAAGPAPHVEHSYLETLNAVDRFQTFPVSVTVTDNGKAATTSKTLTKWNLYVIDRDDHRVLRPVVTAPREFTEQAGSARTQYSVVNPESHPLQLTRKYVEYLFCNPDVDNQILPMQAVSITVPSQGYYVGTETFPLASIPAGVCKVGLHLRGLDGSNLVQADTYLKLPSRTQWRGVTAPTMIALLKRIRDNNWVEDPQTIRGVDLRRLVLERRITQAELDAAYADQGASPQAPGSECTPGDVHPNDPNLVCERTEGWETNSAGWQVTNARKGDLLLVPGCGIVAAAIRNITPKQLYVHEAIMTRNRGELAEVTVFEKRFVDHADGIFGARGTTRDALKWAEPGGLISTVQRAFNGIPLTDADGHDYVLNDFSAVPEYCAGDMVATPPKVVKPPIETDSLVRSKLYAAANKARDLVNLRKPHYRLFGFTQGNIPWLEAFSHNGRPAAISSVFVWWALKQAEWDNNIEIPLEGCKLDRTGSLPKWKCSDLDLEQKDLGPAVGAEVDELSWDGAYRYRGDERARGLAGIRDFIKQKVAQEKGLQATTVLADESFAARITNCFGYDICAENGRPCSESACNSPSCCSAQETPQNTSPSCYTVCNQEDNLIREGANEGHTTSPDDFLKWDMPAGSWTAEPGENGVYGATEILDIDDVEHRNRYAWQPAKGQGSVRGHVFFKENTCAVVGEFSCPDNGTCLNGVCVFPAANVQVSILGGDNNTFVTGSDGAYTFPSVRAGDFEVSAYSQTNNIGQLFPYGAQATVTVPVQGPPVEQDLVLERIVDVHDRVVTLSGDLRLIDCDCFSRPEDKKRHVEITCRVSPSNPQDSLGDKYCADEVGLELDGTCDLQPDDSVKVNIQAILRESNSGSCGGTDVEDRTTRRDIFIPPEPAAPTPFNESRLINETRCAFRQCDDKAFFQNLVFSNKVAPF